MSGLRSVEPCLEHELLQMPPVHRLCVAQRGRGAIRNELSGFGRKWDGRERGPQFDGGDIAGDRRGSRRHGNVLVESGAGFRSFGDEPPKPSSGCL
jgi:hypothetical protein